MSDDKLRAEFEAWCKKEKQDFLTWYSIIGKAYRAAHASGYRAGLERAREICLTSAVQYEDIARTAKEELKLLLEARADENRGNAAAISGVIQKEIEK